MQPFKNIMPHFMRQCVLMALLASLTSCANLSQDHGFADVSQSVAPHLKQTLAWPKSTNDEDALNSHINALLSKPLDAESAVQIALMNNKGLRAQYLRLGIADAELMQAGRLPNPKLSLLYTKHQGDYKIEQILSFNVFALAAMPKLKEIERQNFEITKKEVAIEVLRLASETRAAYYEAVAANQAVDYMQQVKESSEASDELATRMVKAGNWSKLDAAREHAFYLDALLELKRSKLSQKTSQERLIRLLGLSDVQAKLNLANKLPDLPETIQAQQGALQSAMEQRFDLQIARLNTESLAKQLGFTKATRFINVLELGPARVLEGSRTGPYKDGVDISFELPIFDWSQSRVFKAEAIYSQALNQVGQLAVNAQSDVRVKYTSYQLSYEIAKQYRDEVVPLKQTISNENVLRYNGMLVSVFDLLMDAKAQMLSVNQYIQALRDFWLAENALNMALIGVSASSDGLSSSKGY